MRKIAFSFAPLVADEAQGVIIRRAIGGDRMMLLDPFLLLDHVTIDPAHGSGEIGFPRHPHRGIETLSYVISGKVSHRDSLGNSGQVGAGGTQWMTAGNGIFHEEMLAPEEGAGEFLQLWTNLPAASKRIPAGYVGAESVPVVSEGDATVRVIAGEFGGVAGAFSDIAVSPTILDIELDIFGRVTLSGLGGKSAFAYVLKGAVRSEGEAVEGPTLAVFTDGESLVLKAGEDGARLFFGAALPLGEPILQYRSLVMNTTDDIAETLAMIASDDFGKP
ncbi:MAG: pirin family protein [Fimbriimonas sp.]